MAAMRRRLRAGCVLGMVLWPLSLEARADEESTTAEALFRAGREAMKQGDYEEACPRLRESQRLDPALGTLLNLALCEEELSNLLAAWRHYQTILAELPEDDPRRELAETHSAEVKSKLAWVVLEAAGPLPADTVVRSGDLELTPAGFGDRFPVVSGT